ncbi:hypothetical protein OBBRIDRAFT_790412 [Obba rivulosa]|uniref:Uncharacterized protein n=1 Tax=Obba rivulosa TaxID=1052685 RepID=A0A8E2DP95_9APHY|nr:hypothetical protein OBBRIDRAFT_790412 [Obba rivulosa]
MSACRILPAEGIVWTHAWQRRCDLVTSERGQDTQYGCCEQQACIPGVLCDHDARVSDDAARQSAEQVKRSLTLIL